MPPPPRTVGQYRRRGQQVAQYLNTRDSDRFPTMGMTVSWDPSSQGALPTARKTLAGPRGTQRGLLGSPGDREAPRGWPSNTGRSCRSTLPVPSCACSSASCSASSSSCWAAGVGCGPTPRGMWVCTYVHVMCVYACVCVYVCVFMYAYLHICMCIHILCVCVWYVGGHRHDVQVPPGPPGLTPLPTVEAGRPPSQVFKKALSFGLGVI